MQELDICQIDAAVCDAVEKNIPLTVTFESGGWMNLRSRFVAVDGDHLLVEIPVDPAGVTPRLTPAQKVDLSFKLKHHKYLTQVRIAGYSNPSLDDNIEGETLSLCLPLHMQRIQRRSYSRVSVPAGKTIRVSIWSGSKNCEPTGPTGAPVWSGTLMDFSAGGFRAVISGDDSLSLKEGDSVGVRIAFDNARESIYSDAQFRRYDTVGKNISLGFQFVGLAHTSAGRDVLQTISRKMAEIMRSAKRAG
jgi:c-di-GMP-binding flagellar brake protein YcgR